ncbi:MAG: bacillithiol biosynthesis cysteine-adding enzyme BshC [Blastocatellia bacterium]|nr:bacillithiol biosynthesis cysteine-adding enzyme BshC [Blastocatellia bacterium]
MDLDLATRVAVGASPEEHSNVPFLAIPGQSRLFLDHLADPASLSRFYPSPVARIQDIAPFSKEVLARYETDRNQLAVALEGFNRRIGSGDKVLRNIERLRKPDTVAVLTGQQTGLFTGPIYSIYKALTAIAAAEKLTAQGVSAVPVFWAATEDHDLEEVSAAKLIDLKGRLTSVSYKAQNEFSGRAVGEIVLTDEVRQAVGHAFEQLEKTEFTKDVRALVEDAWQSGRSFGDAFCSLLMRLLGDRGLVIVSPTEAAFKELAAPIYQKAIGQAVALRDRLIARSAELTAAGYEPQVLIDDDHFPMFIRSARSQRVPLRLTPKGRIRAKDGSTEFSVDELIEFAGNSPEDLSPGVVLRATVQDHIFPTVCYFGGGAEVAYFAQSSVVYETLDRPVTPIFHRQSFTIVEPSSSRTMLQYDLTLSDLFRGKDDVLRELAERLFGRTTAVSIADAEEIINTQLNRLDRELSEKDPTLGAAVATRRRKIIYHISALREKFYRSELRRNEVFTRRMDALFDQIYPESGLQERSISVLYFLNKYGHAFMNRLAAEIDLDNKDHRLLYL